MDFIALNDQIRAEAQDTLKNSEQFLLFAFPAEGDEGKPTVYASCESRGIYWAGAYLAREIMNQALAEATLDFVGDESELPEEIQEMLRRARGEE